MRNWMIFLAGIAVGACAGIFFSATHFREKYETEEPSENASEEKPADDIPEIDPERLAKAKVAYASLTRDYVKTVEPIEEEDDLPFYISRSTDPDSSASEEARKEPYEIDPYEYGNKEGFEAYSYTMYEDGVFTDETDKALGEDEIEETLGVSIRRRMAESTGSVYIRNEQKQSDYEILEVLHPYSEVLRDKPYLGHGDVIMNAAVQTIAAEDEKEE